MEVDGPCTSGNGGCRVGVSFVTAVRDIQDVFCKGRHDKVVQCRPFNRDLRLLYHQGIVRAPAHGKG
jgi:hypothetical protein